MSFLYGPKELAEMEEDGIGECSVPNYRLAPDEPVTPPCNAGFAETLAGVYERRGFPRCAATVRELVREARP